MPRHSNVVGKRFEHTDVCGGGEGGHVGPVNQPGHAKALYKFSDGARPKTTKFSDGARPKPSENLVSEPCVRNRRPRAGFGPVLHRPHCDHFASLSLCSS